MKSKLLILIFGMFLISFISGTNQSNDNCVIIYDFILEHYNGTLTYLVYEFEDLKNETNLTTIELKDYLLNYEDKCYLILPFEDYNIKEEINIDTETPKERILDLIRGMFDNPKSFLMVISLLIIIILAIKMIQDL